MPGFPTQFVGTPTHRGKARRYNRKRKHRSEDRPLQLLVAEGYDGVDAGGAAGGDEAGQQSDKREQGGDAGEGERVGGADAEKKAGQEARDPERSSDSQDKTEKRQARSLTENEAEDIAALGAKSDADAKFLGALRDAVGDQAVDAHGGEQQSDGGKNSEKQHGEARAGKRIGEKLIHRGDGGHGLFGVQLLKLRVDSGNHGQGITGSAHQNRHSGIDELRHGPINGGLRGDVEPHLADIADHADDFRRVELVFVKALHVDGGFLAEGIDAVQVFVRESLVEDGHMLFLRHFLFTEETPSTQRNAHRSEIFGSDDADARHGKIRQRLLRLAEQVDAGGGTQTGERRKILHGDGANSRNGADASEQLLEESHLQFVRGVLGPRKCDLEGQEVGGIKAGMDADEA